MPKLSSEALDERKYHILRAAETCFARDGFHRTTIADICREADVSTGAVYTYFRNKEAIIRGILDEAQATRRAQLDAQIDAPKTDRANVLLQWVSGIFSEAGGHASKIDLNLWSEAVHNKRVAKIAANALHQVNAMVTELMAHRPRSDSRLQRLPPDALAVVVVSIFLGLEVQAGIGLAPDVPALIRTLEALFEVAPVDKPPSRAQRPGPTTKPR